MAGGCLFLVMKKHRGAQPGSKQPASEKGRGQKGDDKKKSVRKGIYRESWLQLLAKAEKRDSNQREAENPLKRSSAHITRRGATGPKSGLPRQPGVGNPRTWEKHPKMVKVLALGEDSD